MSEGLRIGSRASRLALAQAESVAAALRAAHPGLEVRIDPFRTAGDRDRRTPLARLGGAGFFVKELQAALLDARIDLAVHSMKDVPTAGPEGLEAEAAVPPRADPRDCLVTRAGVALADLAPGAVVGSSSPRRRAMILAARPDLRVVDLRGNVETRLAKVESGACDATLLARAGLERLGLLGPRAVPLDASVVLPAAGQGALGLEFRAADERVRRLLGPLDDAPSRWAVVAERALVRHLRAGCSTPLGALARVDAAGTLALEAWLLAPDGRRAVRGREAGPMAEAAEVGARLAERLLAEGGGALLGPAAGAGERGAGRGME